MRTLATLPIAVSGSYDATVRGCGLDAGAPLVEPLEAHENFVNAVALGELGGRPIAVSGGDDEIVWVWDMGAGGPLGESPWRAKATGSPRVDLEELRDAVSAELRQPVS